MDQAIGCPDDSKISGSPSVSPSTILHLNHSSPFQGKSLLSLPFHQSTVPLVPQGFYLLGSWGPGHPPEEKVSSCLVVGTILVIPADNSELCFVWIISYSFSYELSRTCLTPLYSLSISFHLYVSHHNSLLCHLLTLAFPAGAKVPLLIYSCWWCIVVETLRK